MHISHCLKVVCTSIVAFQISTQHSLTAEMILPGSVSGCILSYATVEEEFLSCTRRSNLAVSLPRNRNTVHLKSAYFASLSVGSATGGRPITGTLPMAHGKVEEEVSRWRESNLSQVSAIINGHVPVHHNDISPQGISGGEERLLSIS